MKRKNLTELPNVRSTKKFIDISRDTIVKSITEHLMVNRPILKKSDTKRTTISFFSSSSFSSFSYDGNEYDTIPVKTNPITNFTKSTIAVPISLVDRSLENYKKSSSFDYLINEGGKEIFTENILLYFSNRYLLDVLAVTCKWMFRICSKIAKKKFRSNFYRWFEQIKSWYIEKNPYRFYSYYFYCDDDDDNDDNNKSKLKIKHYSSDKKHHHYRDDIKIDIDGKEKNSINLVESKSSSIEIGWTLKKKHSKRSIGCSIGRLSSQQQYLRLSKNSKKENNDDDDDLYHRDKNDEEEEEEEKKTEPSVINRCCPDKYKLDFSNPKKFKNHIEIPSDPLSRGNVEYRTRAMLSLKDLKMEKNRIDQNDDHYYHRHHHHHHHHHNDQLHHHNDQNRNDKNYKNLELNFSNQKNRSVTKLLSTKKNLSSSSSLSSFEWKGKKEDEKSPYILFKYKNNKREINESVDDYTRRNEYHWFPSNKDFYVVSKSYFHLENKSLPYWIAVSKRTGNIFRLVNKKNCDFNRSSQFYLVYKSIAEVSTPYCLDRKIRGNIFDPTKSNSYHLFTKNGKWKSISLSSKKE